MAGEGGAPGSPTLFGGAGEKERPAPAGPAFLHAERGGVASEPAVDRAGDVELALVHDRAQQPAAVLLDQPARLLDQRSAGALRLDDEDDAGRPRRQGRAAEIGE